MYSVVFRNKRSGGIVISKCNGSYAVRGLALVKILVFGSPLMNTPKSTGIVILHPFAGHPGYFGHSVGHSVGHSFCPLTAKLIHIAIKMMVVKERHAYPHHGVGRDFFCRYAWREHVGNGSVGAIDVGDIGVTVGA